MGCLPCHGGHAACYCYVPLCLAMVFSQPGLAANCHMLKWRKARIFTMHHDGRVHANARCTPLLQLCWMAEYCSLLPASAVLMQRQASYTLSVYWSMKGALAWQLLHLL